MTSSSIDVDLTICLQVLDAWGYPAAFRAFDVKPAGSSDVVPMVAFTRAAPRDIHTSAVLVGAGAHPEQVERSLTAARMLATPVALLVGRDRLDMYAVGASSAGTTLVVSTDSETGALDSLARFSAAVAPASIHASKSGSRQLTLFPIDARLLPNARSKSVDSLTARLHDAFTVASDSVADPVVAARLSITTLAGLIVDHKYNQGVRQPPGMLDRALQHHPDYFRALAEWQIEQSKTFEQMVSALGDGVDYSTIDARTVNSVYESLFVTPRLRKTLGVYYTDADLATRILEAVPVETIAPDERRVFDPSCGSGNLLLAAQERLDGLNPVDWDPRDAAAWMRVHLAGADVDPVAVEIARLSLLVSALPLGNSWDVTVADALAAPTSAEVPPPTVLVTNPPWRNPKGRQGETASRFLERAIERLAVGGLLACLLPATWLTGESHARSRRGVLGQCDVFEVWRLPRDMFPDARVGTAVVFAQKVATPRGRFVAMRWVNATKRARDDFLSDGVTVVRSVTDSLEGPWTPTMLPTLDGLTQPLGDVAKVTSGVIQKGQPAIRSDGIPMLLRNSSPQIYGTLKSNDVTRVADLGHVVSGRARVEPLASTRPKLLVQADRFADNPWRLRAVLDTIGVCPVGVWNIVTAPAADLYALHALLASSIPSAWVHARTATNRISTATLEALPLPPRWGKDKSLLAQLGRELARSPQDEDLLARIEHAAAKAYGVTSREMKTLRELFAGFESPEGVVRFQPNVAARQSALEDVGVRSGAVLNVDPPMLTIWTVDGPDEGETVELPMHMQGWLVEPGATFVLDGSVSDGRYSLHRSTHLPDEAIF